MDNRDCSRIALLCSRKGETKNVIFTPGIVLIED